MYAEIIKGLVDIANVDYTVNYKYGGISLISGCRQRRTRKYKTFNWAHMQLQRRWPISPEQSEPV